MQNKPTTQVILVNPQIPQNTGSVGRTCVGLGLPLVLAGKLGFTITETRVKRAGLDYWPNLQLSFAPDLTLLEAKLQQNPPVLFTTKGKQAPWQIDLSKASALCFGSEIDGFPQHWYSFGWPMVCFPALPGFRSYNLASSVQAGVMEWARQVNWQNT